MSDDHDVTRQVMALGRDLDGLLGVQVEDKVITVWVATSEEGQTLAGRLEENEDFQGLTQEYTLIYRKD